MRGDIPAESSSDIQMKALSFVFRRSTTARVESKANQFLQAT